MKIIFVSYTFWPPDFGGELLLTIERLQSLAAQGHSVTVLTSGKQGLPGREERDGMTVYRSPAVHASRPGRLCRRLFFPLWVLGKLSSLSYDSVHVGSPGGIGSITAAISGWLIAKVTAREGGRSVTVHALADSEDQPVALASGSGVFRRAYLSVVDRVVGVSPGLFQALHDAFPSSSVLLINGVRDDIFTPLSGERRQEVREMMGVGAQDVVFTFLGSVTRRKGFDVLARVFREESTIHPRWGLWVIGPTSYSENQNMDEAEVEAVTCPVQDHPRVEFLGRIDDRLHLARLLAASDVFVFPSRREGFGLAPVEAMAAGVPVIMSRIPGITDLANVHNVTGLYVSPGSAGDLREAMKKLAEDATLREEMGKAARRRVVDDFSWEQHVKAWERLYRGERVTRRTDSE